MGSDEVVEYRMLAANNQAASVSLFASGLRITTCGRCRGWRLGRKGVAETVDPTTGKPKSKI